ENGYFEIVQLLIQQGADAHYKSEYTALQLAEMADQQQIVEYLMNL
ncbi:ankyrin repeat domain-containing protein, partial [Acinetobacter sp. TY1]